MAKKKACKKCKIFVTGNECPICKGDNFTTGWKGRIIIFNAEASEIAGALVGYFDTLSRVYGRIENDKCNKTLKIIN